MLLISEDSLSADLGILVEHNSRFLKQIVDTVTAAEHALIAVCVYICVYMNVGNRPPACKRAKDDAHLKQSLTSESMFLTPDCNIVSLFEAQRPGITLCFWFMASTFVVRSTTFYCISPLHTPSRKMLVSFLPCQSPTCQASIIGTWSCNAPRLANPNVICSAPSCTGMERFSRDMSSEGAGMKNMMQAVRQSRAEEDIGSMQFPLAPEERQRLDSLLHAFVRGPTGGGPA